MQELEPRPLTTKDFAPFGVVIELKKTAVGARAVYASFMRNLRPAASLDMAIIRKSPEELPLPVKWLERHPYSSQAFIPVEVPAFLVLVCPTNRAGEPVVNEAQAFIGRTEQGFCYAPNVWHHPFVTLGGDGEFVTLRYDDGSAADTLWHEVHNGPQVVHRAGSTK